ncbi:MAG: IS630 family transposase, partial [Cumulibacter sp.]
MDEFSKQLLSHCTPPVPGKPGSVTKEDYEYVRHGSVTAFMLFAPFEGWREVYTGPTGQRMALEYAEALRILAEEVFVKAEKIIL